MGFNSGFKGLTVSKLTWPIVIVQSMDMACHLLAIGTNCFHGDDHRSCDDSASTGRAGWETSHHTDRAIHATAL